MGELVIQYHDFENAKEEIKQFSEQTTTDLDLEKVDDSKGVGEFLKDWLFGRGIGLEHQVTGEELNELTSQIQTHLHSINNTQIKLIREFGQVYSALEALDKDYIQSILISIKATEETSQGIQETQGQIRKIVENQRKTLEELKKFKQELDGYAHLGDIDKIWSDCQEWYKEKNALSKVIDGVAGSSKESASKADAVKVSLSAAEKKIEGLSQQTNSLIERVESIIAFTTAMEQVTHLKDVDVMWESLSAAHDSIRSISSEAEAIQKTVSKNQEDIKNILVFVEKLSALNHLMEVDEIWRQTEDYQIRINRVEQKGKSHTDKLDELVQANDRMRESIVSNAHNISALKEYKDKLSGISHLNDVDSTWKNVEEHTSKLVECERRDEDLAVTIQKNKEEVNENIAEAVQTANAAIKSLTKKVKYAYWIAGGSVGLAIIEMILLLMKVI